MRSSGPCLANARAAEWEFCKREKYISLRYIGVCGDTELEAVGEDVDVYGSYLSGGGVSRKVVISDIVSISLMIVYRPI